MNKVLLIGRLTGAPIVKYTEGAEPLCIARFTLAVNRRGKKDDADFISCVAFGKRGEFAEKYLKKGVKIALCGSLQTGSYEKNGTKFYTTDVVADEIEFAESKAKDAEPVKENTVPDDLPFK